jgi:predicted nucleic acid-binding protein
VSRIVLLDAGPLGLASNPRYSPQNHACAQWLQAIVGAGARVVIPEIADYEIRRELLRAGKTRGVAKLDAMAHWLEYLPISTTAMRQAAEFWARARQQGQPTASDAALDADMILAGQAATLNAPGVVIATTNVSHLAAFVLADLWQNIAPS